MSRENWILIRPPTGKSVSSASGALKITVGGGSGGSGGPATSTGISEGAVVSRGPAAVDRHAVAIGEQNATAAGADRLVQSVHGRPGRAQQRRDTFPHARKLAVAEPERRSRSGGIKLMQTG